MAVLPTGEPLVGSTVRLDLLTEADLPALAEVLADPEVYRSGYVVHRCPTSVEDGVKLGWQRFLAQQRELDGKGNGRTAYAVRLVGDGTFVGTSSLWEADLAHEKIHVGSTLYGSRWWGTEVNPECKLLLMRHAFEECGYGRVKIQTDLLNTRSQAAIAKLGAVREGVLRRDQRREDGTWRDTVVFSVLIDEWPAVEESLRARLY